MERDFSCDSELGALPDSDDSNASILDSSDCLAMHVGELGRPPKNPKDRLMLTLCLCFILYIFGLVHFFSLSISLGRRLPSQYHLRAFSQVADAHS